MSAVRETLVRTLNHEPLVRIWRDKLKPLVVRMLGIMLRELPEVSYRNLCYENSRLLFQLKEEFFKHNGNYEYGYREKEFTAIWLFTIMLYDSDLYYRERINWLVGRIREIPWQVEAGEEEPRERWWKREPQQVNT